MENEKERERERERKEKKNRVNKDAPYSIIELIKQTFALDVKLYFYFFPIPNSKRLKNL